jgi:hypothetical protein
MTADARIMLRCGVTARLAPYLLLTRLESEGFAFKLGDDDVLVSPFSRLRPDDRAALLGYKDDVIRILRYTPSDARSQEPMRSGNDHADQKARPGRGVNRSLASNASKPAG